MRDVMAVRWASVVAGATPCTCVERAASCWVRVSFCSPIAWTFWWRVSKSPWRCSFWREMAKRRAMVSISVVAKSCVLAVLRNWERGWRLGSSNTEVTVLASAGRTYSATGSGTRGRVDCPSSGIVGMWGRLREELVFWLGNFCRKQ